MKLAQSPFYALGKYPKVDLAFYWQLEYLIGVIYHSGMITPANQRENLNSSKQMNYVRMCNLALSLQVCFVHVVKAKPWLIPNWVRDNHTLALVNEKKTGRNWAVTILRNGQISSILAYAIPFDYTF